MRLLIVISLLLISLVESYAQVFVRSESSSIRIKWITPELLFEDGVNIQRSSNGGAYTQVNKAPIKPYQHEINYDLVKDAEATKSMAKAFTSPDFEMPKDPLAQLMIYTTIIPNSELAKYIGIEFSDNSVQPNTSYTYQVKNAKSGDLLGTSETIKPDAAKSQLGPIDVISYAKNKSVSLGWANESGRYYGVAIYRTNRALSEETKLNSLPILYSDGAKRKGRSFQFVDETVVKDQVYDYRLVAIDFFGEEAGSTIAAELGAQDIIPPLAPTNIDFEPDHKAKTLGVSWEAELADDHAGFIISLSRTDTSAFKEKVRVMGDSLYTYLQLSQIGRYLVAVQAFDKSGNASRAKYDVAYLEDKESPAVPSGLTVKVDSNLVTLSWDDVAAPDLDGYLIYRKKSAKASLLKITSSALKGNTHTDVFPKNFVSDITYQIASRDTNGNFSEMTLPVAISFADGNAPSAPQIQKAGFASNGYTIEWVGPTATDLEGFNVYRSSKADSIWQKVNKLEIASFATRYTDNNLADAKEYSYAITAYDTAGNESEKSNIKRFKTQVEELTPTIKSFKASVNKRTQKVSLKWEIENPETLLGCIVYQRDKRSDNWTAISGKLSNPFFEHKPSTSGENFYQIKVFDIKGKKQLSETKSLFIKL